MDLPSVALSWFDHVEGILSKYFDVGLDVDLRKVFWRSEKLLQSPLQGQSQELQCDFLCNRVGIAFSAPPDNASLFHPEIGDRIRHTVRKCVDFNLHEGNLCGP